MPNDARIRVLVRSVLSRHWIDVAKIRVHVHQGSVRLSGDLCRLPGHAALGGDADLVLHIATEIQRLPEVVRVYMTDLTFLRSGAPARKDDEKGKG